MCRVKSRHREPRAARTGGDPSQLVTEFGRRLLATGDPLEAEIIAAAVLALPHRERIGPVLADLFVRAVCEVAGGRPAAESAALLRALVAVAPPGQRGAAVAALGTVTAAGHYPPEWASQIGRAQPGAAWRSFDVFGDTETVAVTFRYGEVEHAAVVQIDRCRPPTVLRAAVLPDVDQLRSALEDGDDPLRRTEPIELADARARIEPALASDLHPAELSDLDDGSWLSLPVVRARVRRLPAPAPAPPGGSTGPAGDRPVGNGPAGFGPAERAATVAEFLASSYAAEAGADVTARFWAEVFAGYSASVPGDPPARIGLLKLPHLLLSYVPNTFALSAEQRQGLPAAATAWTEWAGQRQDLSEPARAALRARVPEVLARFDAAYEDPDNCRQRSYLADLAATTTDAGVLAEALHRRTLAVPPPDQRTDERLQSVDAADPAGRRALVAEEYGGCQPPEGMSRPDFLATAVRLAEQLWRDDPPELWRRARELADTGVPDHEIIHRLAAGGASDQ
jgi:hypothetical protein